MISTLAGDAPTLHLTSTAVRRANPENADIRHVYHVVLRIDLMVTDRGPLN